VLPAISQQTSWRKPGVTLGNVCRGKLLI